MTITLFLILTLKLDMILTIRNLQYKMVEHSLSLITNYMKTQRIFDFPKACNVLIICL